MNPKPKNNKTIPPSAPAAPVRPVLTRAYVPHTVSKTPTEAIISAEESCIFHNPATAAGSSFLKFRNISSSCFSSKTPSTGPCGLVSTGVSMFTAGSSGAGFPTFPGSTSLPRAWLSVSALAARSASSRCRLTSSKRSCSQGGGSKGFLALVAGGGLKSKPSSLNVCLPC